MEPLTDHWKPIAAVVTALTGWLGRRRVGDIWRSWCEIRDAKQLLTTCEVERDYATNALARMVAAGKLVEEAASLGLIRPSDDLAKRPSTSRTASSRSPSPLELPATRSTFPPPRSDDDER